MEIKEGETYQTQGGALWVVLSVTENGKISLLSQDGDSIWTTVSRFVARVARKIN